MESSEVLAKYQELIDKCQHEIQQTEQKAQRAMRIVLWMKIILALASVAAVGAWLKGHEAKELWAVIILGSKIADVMLDTLPYAQQKEKLPQLKLKLVDLFLEIENDYMLLQRNEITPDKAIKKLYAHRNAWVKSLS